MRVHVRLHASQRTVWSSFDGTTKKERVLTEYFKRVREIWSSELSGYNKFLFHHAFAVPVLIPTFGLLQWAIDEIDNIDKKNKKNYHYDQ